MAAVTTKVEGWVERLHLNTTGQAVRRGAPILEIYSPDLLLAQQEYLVAIHRLQAAKAANAADEIAAANRLVEGATQRLKYWDISDDQIEGLRRSGTVQRRLVLHAPVSGQVMEKRSSKACASCPASRCSRSPISRLYGSLPRCSSRIWA
jgi:membrane fusion protein, copper/silver efflux system